MRNGYILLHRQGLTQEEWKHPLRTLAWIDLLTLAAWEDFTNSDGVNLKRGEIIASETFLATRWRQNRGTIHRWLLFWESQQMVQRVVQHRSQQVPQRIFLLNYAKYQDGSQQVPQQLEKQVSKKLPQIMKVKEGNSNNQKENKERPERKTLTDDEAGRAFRQVLVEHQWSDEHYADKTWDQGCQLSGADRVEFFRKVRYMLAISKLPAKAKIVYHEISGLVNDRGAMKRLLTPQEKQAREDFADNTHEE